MVKNEFDENQFSPVHFDRKIMIESSNVSLNSLFRKQE